MLYPGSHGQILSIRRQTNSLDKPPLVRGDAITPVRILRRLAVRCHKINQGSLERHEEGNYEMEMEKEYPIGPAVFDGSGILVYEEGEAARVFHDNCIVRALHGR